MEPPLSGRKNNNNNKKGVGGGGGGGPQKMIDFVTQKQTLDVT